MEVENKKLEKLIHSAISEALTKIQHALEREPENPPQMIEGMIKAHEELQAAGFAMLGGSMHAAKEFARSDASPADVRTIWVLTLARAESTRERMMATTLKQVERETGLRFEPSHNEQLRESILRELDK